jgi:hypothetical protein
MKVSKDRRRQCNEEETYATALAFLLLVLKAGLYMKGR